MPGRAGWLWIALLPPACIAYQWLVHAAIVDAETTSTRAALAALNGVPHAAINIFLAWVFGRTLVRGREALITGFARRVHGTIPAYIESYTHRVTGAWCVFFVAQVLVSAILLAVGSLASWSLFVNVLGAPLVVVMFGGEYLYRIARFPNYPHVPIWKGVQMFLGHRRSARPTQAPSQN
jgi:uncharacterized membrane protein